MGGVASPLADRSARRDLTALTWLRAGSFLGDFVALTALFLRLAPAGHAWAVAGLAGASTLPLVLLAPVAGQVVDRVSAKALLVAAGLAETVVCLGLAAWHSVGATLGLMAALGCLVAFSMTGYMALVPRVVGEDHVAWAQGRLQAVQGAASVLGPVLGGLLVGSTGQGWPLVIDAASYLLASLVTASLRHDRRHSTESTVAEARAEGPGMMAGVSRLARDGVLRPVILTVMVFMLGLGMVNVAEVFFTTVTLHASATLYGLVGTAFGAGTVLGSLLAPRVGQADLSLSRALMSAIVVVGVGIGTVGLVTRVAWMYPCLFVAGVAVGVANVAATTLCTLRTPEAERGRVFAALAAVVNGSELASMALGGLMLSYLSPRTVFQIAGVAATASALVLGPRALAAARRHLAP